MVIQLPQSESTSVWNLRKAVLLLPWKTFPEMQKKVLRRPLTEGRAGIFPDVQSQRDSLKSKHRNSFLYIPWSTQRFVTDLGSHRRSPLYAFKHAFCFSNVLLKGNVCDDMDSKILFSGLCVPEEPDQQSSRGGTKSSCSISAVLTPPLIPEQE